jgi:D-alanyl-D-alanine carboxypeptidase
MLNKYLNRFFIVILLLTTSVYAAESGDANKIEKAVKDYGSHHRLQSTYAFAVDGEITTSGASGFSSLEHNSRLSVNSIMPLASGTKTFTAVSILRLYDQGKIDLKASIFKYLDAKMIAHNKKQYNELKKITIHHLLTHTSGLMDYVYTYKINSLDTESENNIRLTKYIFDAALVSTPGKNYVYSNSNYFLLSIIVEKISGMTLADFMQQELFAPLNMHNTKIVSYHEGLDFQYGKNKNYPTRYYIIPNNTHNPMYQPVGQEFIVAPSGDGGAVSTVEDLIKWQNALHNSHIISDDAYSKMTTKYVVSHAKDGYEGYIGYGIYITYTKDGTLIYHHEGRALGIRSDSGYLPNKKISYAIISNAMFYIPDALKDKIDIKLPSNQLDILYFRDFILNGV